MTQGVPSPAWLRWLLLAAFAGCLNPHPDDEPTLVSSPPTVSGGKDAPDGANTGASDGPSFPIGDDEGAGGQREPTQEPAPDSADAGVPSADAGGDAGPG